MSPQCGETGINHTRINSEALNTSSLKANAIKVCETENQTMKSREKWETWRGSEAVMKSWR